MSASNLPPLPPGADPYPGNTGVLAIAFDLQHAGRQWVRWAESEAGQQALRDHKVMQWVRELESPIDIFHENGEWFCNLLIDGADGSLIVSAMGKTITEAIEDAQRELAAKEAMGDVD